MPTLFANLALRCGILISVVFRVFEVDVSLLESYIAVTDCLEPNVCKTLPKPLYEAQCCGSFFTNSTTSNEFSSREIHSYLVKKSTSTKSPG